MIMGKSGSGKTTLLNLLGLLDSFDDGEYRLKGKNVIGLNENERSTLRNLNMGFIFQQFHLIDSLTIGQNVELPLLYKGGVAKKNREKLVNKYLDLVGLRSKKDRIGCICPVTKENRFSAVKHLTSPKSTARMCFIIRAAYWKNRRTLHAICSAQRKRCSRRRVLPSPSAQCCIWHSWMQSSAAEVRPSLPRATHTRCF